ncbi:MAG: hypothetical protein QNJ26_02765 [Desulfobacterales bacterium]|nr:hypothetical protein [Desulfobacterales bacterium]
MKVKLFGILFISTVVCIIFMAPIESPAAQYTCFVKAGREDAHVVVNDYDRDGNRLPRGGEIYRGVVKRGQRQQIKSRFGKIRYNYRLYNQSRTSGRNSTNCEGGKNIQLP